MREVRGARQPARLGAARGLTVRRTRGGEHRPVRDVGSAVMLGSYAAKPFVLRMAPERFGFLMDALMLVAGVTMIATALA